MVLAALGEGVWGELVVGSVECAIDGLVNCALHDTLSLFLLLLLQMDFVDTPIQMWVSIWLCPID
jgi:hypothetical protein